MDIRKFLGGTPSAKKLLTKEASPSVAKKRKAEEIVSISSGDDQVEEVRSPKQPSNTKSPRKASSVKQKAATKASPVVELDPDESKESTKPRRSPSKSPSKPSPVKAQDEESPARKSSKKKRKVVDEENDEDEAESIVVTKTFSTNKETSSSLRGLASKDEDSRPRPQAPPAAKSEHQLWADKYAPETFDDLVGAQTLVKNLNKWLKEWDDVHLHKRIKIPYEKSNPGARAALLSGPPGIGKSTTARLVAEHCGREIYELNASDTRSKRLLSEELSDVVQAGVVNFGGKKTQKKRVIIMDEVDGMSASDRGGITELIKIIKTTRTPIICICNDYSKSSVRSLSNHCFDLKFQRPQVPSILKRLKEIAKKEDLKVDDEALEGFVKSSGNDIRQVLNALQMWRVSSAQLKGNDAKERIGSINKDAVLRLSGFDATRFIFCESHVQPLFKRNEAFFADYDMIPLMVSQNYISAIQSSQTCRNEVAKMKRLAQAADAVCDADVVARYVRSDQRWDLLTSQAIMNIRVAHICDGPIGFPGFPEWLGKNSNATKRSRLLGELSTHVRASVSGTSLDRQSLRMEYIPAMRSTFVVPLATQGTEAVDQVIKFLDDYSMSRDDLFETLAELQFPEGPEFKDYYKLIQPQAKAAFTREYNKRAHKSQVLVGEEGVSKKSKKRQATADVNEEDEEFEGEEEAEEDDIDLEAFRAKASKKKSAATSTSTSGSKKARKS